MRSHYKFKGVRIISSRALALQVQGRRHYKLKSARITSSKALLLHVQGRLYYNQKTVCITSLRALALHVQGRWCYNQEAVCITSSRAPSRSKQRKTKHIKTTQTTHIEPRNPTQNTITQSKAKEMTTEENDNNRTRATRGRWKAIGDLYAQWRVAEMSASIAHLGRSQE